MFRTIALLLLLSSALFAQGSNGYFFIAPGGASGSSTLHLGAGAEGRFARYFGAGAELGALGFTSAWGDSVVGVFSPGLYIHPASDRQLDPYVTGGYTLMFRSGHENLGYIGAGLNWWFRRNLGLKLEFRDHLHSSTSFWQFRFGIAFR